ncbi:MAG TPA: DUF2177 family protein [Burkholderiales bacterium]|jgi:uncharacterized membrane protein|nr:DUF2177 family protein [Burkholderiales bacterium]
MKSSRFAPVAAYLSALVCFLALDTCWLALMGPRLYRPALSGLMAPNVDWVAAILFYLVYIGGLLVFAITPGRRVGRAFVAMQYGAMFGLVAYATYDLTNQATLRDWPWTLTLADIAWGTSVSAIAAAVATRLTFPRGSRTAVQ